MENQTTNTEVSVAVNPELELINKYFDLKVAGIDFCLTLEGFAENSTGATKQILDAIINSDKFIAIKKLSTPE
ncbi:hypothetical protein UFOVP916_22 [uncultured Caudovirales phage]|uniref:Uncharacterized protein n=1 Tax=uncultured Caudovirales phage TaxID=2100421 RepID=A0A6J5Q454_9CAUD|nr:hypothetical protein UFOVP827_43 [uncultured Caudovirales phage]CAB4171451.1 hypothetical protein UFOVP916_22 [uncultured Caudovirales phage]CAB4177427.1 hypothetical protein UFOVP1001_46 [uncultured Caudovirales phage]CAB4199255.1 hypothetical protein UFOVP1338_30 [uncultured Caudovirales phage]CAB4213414.1 hypothetical protein UFOVP1447_25 [uncultured Caudovirales phage]